MRDSSSTWPGVTVAGPGKARMNCTRDRIEHVDGVLRSRHLGYSHLAAVTGVKLLIVGLDVDALHAVRLAHMAEHGLHHKLRRHTHVNVNNSDAEVAVVDKARRALKLGCHIGQILGRHVGANGERQHPARYGPSRNGVASE